jgi:hypothetical protein
MTKVSLELVEKAFNDTGVDFPTREFIQIVERYQREEDEENERIRKEKENKVREEARIKETEYVFDAIPEEQTIDDFLDEWVEEVRDGDLLWNLFYDPKGIDDDGETVDELFLVGDKLYRVSIHCEAEWVSDWSVRKNLPGDYSIESIEEIENFEIIERIENYAKFKI